METTSHFKLLDSIQDEEKTNNQARNLLRLDSHPHLRLVVVNEEPRKCAQSTSERSSSQVTSPPDSRSISIASDSPQGLRPYATLRRWPPVVPQRSANFLRSGGVIDFRNTLSSMSDYHRTVIEKATPSGVFTKWCDTPDNQSMGNPTAPTRRENLKRLLERDFAGNQSRLAREAHPDNPSSSYINDLLRNSGPTKLKPFGETAARKIEANIGLKRGQLDIPDSPLTYEAGHGNRVTEELRDAIEDLGHDERLEALALIRRIQSRRRKAG